MDVGGKTGRDNERFRPAVEDLPTYEGMNANVHD